MNTPTIPADDARQGLEEITIGLDRMRYALDGMIRNGVQAIEESAQRAAEFEQRADQAERDRATAERRASLADSVTTAAKTLLERRTATLRTRAETAEAERDELHAALGLAPGQLHSAALSAIRGRAANIRELTDRAKSADRLATKHRQHAERLAEELAERSKRDGRTEATLQRVRDAETLAQALTAVAEHDGLTPMQAAMSAAFAAAAETPAADAAERERDHAIRLAAVEQGRAEAVRRAERAEQTLLRIRHARTAADAWAAIGTHYHLPAAEAGRAARTWRTTGEHEHERHRRNLAAVFALPADTPFEDIHEYAARTLTRSGERLLASKARAERFEAAWQNARLRAKQAKEREQHARDRAERYRSQRDRWVEIADEHTDKERARANTAEATVARVRALLDTHLGPLATIAVRDALDTPTEG